MTLAIYTADSLGFTVTVRRSDNNDVKDLSNSTAEASIAIIGQPAIAATCEILAPTDQGVLSVFFPEGSFAEKPGRYVCHVRVKDPGNVTNTVKTLDIQIDPSV